MEAVVFFMHSYDKDCSLKIIIIYIIDPRILTEAQKQRIHAHRINTEEYSRN